MEVYFNSILAIVNKHWEYFSMAAPSHVAKGERAWIQGAGT